MLLRALIRQHVTKQLNSKNEDAHELEQSLTPMVSPDALPYYEMETPSDVPVGLRVDASRLQRASKMIHPTQVQHVGGLARVELAYEAGRQAAKGVRGEDTRQSRFAFALSRSPEWYVILPGLKSSDHYPCCFSTFTAYKTHIFEDLHIPHPSHVHPMSVSQSFYSDTEARAYCMRASLPGLVIATGGRS
jgi:hypothetical protein